MMITRRPSPHLRPFVKAIWAGDGLASVAASAAKRERVLPTGTMHLVFRLGDDPLHLFDDENDPVGRTVGHAIIGGARSAFYVRDISRPARSVGVQFHPGAAAQLLGVPANELMERHTPLEDLWGRTSSEMRERLALASSPDRAIDLLESFLTERLGLVRESHPSVAKALELFAVTADVRQAVTASGYSHRQFIALFRHAVGLTPKIYCRILRFQGAIARVAEGPARSWADLAMAAGYSDQAHFNREFREFSGITPGRYRDLAPIWSHHVPIRVPPR